MLNRRAVLKSLSTGLPLAAAGLAEQSSAGTGPIRIWDEHTHLHSVPGATPEERMEYLIRCADRLGIERLLLSQGYSADLHPTPEQLRQENDRVMRAVRRFPERAYGSVYLSPAHPEFSVEEFNRCCTRRTDGQYRGDRSRQALQRSRDGPDCAVRRLPARADPATHLAQSGR